MSPEASPLTAKIGEKLTTEVLLDLIGLSAQSTLQVGDTLKCHCPCCGNQAFRTLFLNTRRHTYECRYTTCTAHAGGDYLTLVALVRGVDEATVISQLISQFGVDVTPAEADELREMLQSRGLEALSDGDLKTARRMLQEASQLPVAGEGEFGLNTEMAAKLAHCCWELGDHEMARRRYRGVLERLIASGDLADAVLILSDLINIDQEWSPELNLILGRLLRDSGDVDQALAHLLEAAEGLCRLGQADLASEAAQELSVLSPESEAGRQVLFQAALVSQDWSEALGLLEPYLALCDAKGDSEAALEALRLLDEAGRLGPAQRVERARRTLAAGDETTTHGIAVTLEAEAERDSEIAEGLISLLGGHTPRPASWELILIRLLLSLERHDSAREAFERLLAATDVAEHGTAIRDAFDAMRGAGVDDMALRLRHLEWIAAHGDPDEVITVSQDLLREAAGVGDASAAETAWRHLRDLASENLPSLAEAVPLLHTATRREEHLGVWRDLISHALETDHPALASRLGRQYLDEIAFYAPVAQAVMTAAQTLGNLREQFPLAERLFEAQRENKDWEGAERTLRLLIEVAESDVRVDGLWDKLAQTLEEAGKPGAASSLFLVRAERAFTAGDRSEAERLLGAARDCAPDRWVHWRAERELARQVGEAPLAERVLAEAFEVADSDDAEADQAQGALTEEADQGHLSGDDFVSLLTLLAHRGQVDQAQALFSKHGQTALGHGPESQRRLVQLLGVLPPFAALWADTLARLSDDEAVAAFQARLPQLARLSEVPLDWRLDLLERALDRWPQSLEALRALAVCRHQAGHTAEAAEIELRLAELHMEGGRPAQSIEILQPLLDRLTPSADALIVRMKQTLAGALEADGQAQAASETWLALAQHLLDHEAESSLGSPGCRVRHALDEARRLTGETPDLLALELRNFEQVMDEEAVTKTAITLADIREKQGDPDVAIELLSRCVAKFGQSVGLLRAQAETLTRAGQQRAAARAWRALFNRHFEHEEFEHCEIILKQLNALAPDTPEHLECGVELALRQGKGELADARLSALVDQLLGAERWLEAVETLKRLAPEFPDPRPVLLRLAEIYRQGSQTGVSAPHLQRNEALAAMRSVIDICLQRGETEAAESHIETFHRWAATDVEARLTLLDSLCDHWSAERLAAGHVDFAQSLRRGGHLDGALVVCQRALSHWPDHRDLLAALAEVHLDAGQEPAAAQPLRTLAEVCEGSGDLDRATAARRRVLTLSVATVGDRWDLAELLARQDPPGAALEPLQWLSDHHRAHHQHADLRRVSERILEIEPNHLGALNTLAETCLHTGDHEAAACHLHRLAQCHLSHNRRAPAERACRQILEFDPDSVPALEALLALQESKGNLKRLTEVAMRLLEIHARDSWERAEALVTTMTEHHPEADAFFGRWVDLLWEGGRRDDAAALCGDRAQRQIEAGRADAAIEVLEHMLQLRPESLDLAERIGQMALEGGERARARRAWLAALSGHRALGDIDREHAVLLRLHELDPKDTGILEALGESKINLGQGTVALDILEDLRDRHRESGDREALRATLEKILSIDPERPDDQRALGELHAEDNRPEQAMALLRSALDGMQPQERWQEVAEVCAQIERLDPTDRSVKQIRGEALAKAGLHSEAIEVHDQLARTAQSEHSYGVARRSWEAILEIDADHLLARDQLAAICAAQGEIRRAVELWSALAETHRLAGDAEAERKILVTLTAAQPHCAPAQRRLAALWLEEGQIDAAWQAYRALLSAAQEAEDVEAWRELEREILSSPGVSRLRSELAALHIEAGRGDEAIALYEQLAREHRDAGVPQAVVATCQLILKVNPEHRGALEMLAEVLPQLGDQTGISLQAIRRRLARARMADGEFEAAVQLLEGLQTESPSDTQILFDLTRAHRATDHFDVLQPLLERGAQAAMASGDPAEFVRLCQDLESPHSLPPDLHRAVLDHVTQTVLSTHRESDHLDLLLQIAEEWANEKSDGETDGDSRLRAAEIHESLVRAAPNEVKPRRRFVDFLLAHGQHTRAVHELLALAALHSERGEPRRVIQTLERAHEIDSENPQVLLRLGQAHLSQNARGRALGMLKRAAHSVRGEGPGARLAELCRNILDIDPSDIDARRELIEILQAEDQIDDATEHSLILADQCAGRGLLDLAVPLYRSVVQRRPSDLETWRRLIEAHVEFGTEEDLLPDFLTVARLCQGEGEAEEAVGWFRRYLTFAPEDLEVRQEFVESFAEVGSADEVRAEYRTLAKLCDAAGRLTQAKVWEKKAKRATPKPGSRRGGRGSSRRSGDKAKASFTGSGASGHRKGESKRRPRRDERPETEFPTTPESKLKRTLKQDLSHLEVNPENARLHMQVAEILHHLRRVDEAFIHWCEASELHFAQEAWDECIALCERLVKLSPRDERLKKRLHTAQLRRDQIRELNSAIDDAE
jgi:tetratricopeptide (TPR) repeat protein